MRQRRLPIFLTLFLSPLLLAACGTRGGLVLPPGPPTPPLLGKPTPNPNVSPPAQLPVPPASTPAPSATPATPAPAKTSAP